MRLLAWFVALRKESVDRNCGTSIGLTYDGLSLSARRAWIEMDGSKSSIEEVSKSLSARRAWIEISSQCR